MRPLKLTMRAFGPYKNQETIDFNELDDHQLFVISGNTGAGKTTIFDAICFALYGSASGEDRENQAMLRSQFANDDIHTSVELLFELKGRTYRIFRQLGHIKKGNKTKTGDQYEFFEIVDGEEIPCVDRQIVTEINEKVEALMGLTEDQFKQIVMLPQGEFRKLLTSETENKEAILRRLFKTEPYKQIGEQLRIRKQQLEQSYQTEKQTCDHYIHQLASLPERSDSLLFQTLNEEHFNVYQILTGLEAELTYYEQKLATDLERYKAIEKEHQQASEMYYKAKALHEKFAEYEEKTKRLNQLTDQQALYEEKGEELEAAERAYNIEPYEKQVLDWKADILHKGTALEKATIQLNEAKAYYEKMEKQYKLEENKAPEREQIKQQLHRLQEFLPTVEAMEEMKSKLNRLKRQALKTYEKIEQTKTQRKQKQEQIETIERSVQQLDEAVSSIGKKEQQRNQLREQHRLLTKHIQYTEKKHHLERVGKEQKQTYIKQKQAYETLEETWLKNQAGMLASHLHDGQPCPVCGSLSHPNKASDGKHLVTREQLDQAKLLFKKVENDYRTTQVEWKRNQAELKEIENEIVTEYNISIEHIPTAREQIIKQGKKLSEDLERLERAQAELKSKRQHLEKGKQQLKELEQQKETLDKVYQEEREQYTGEKAAYTERLRVIPEEMRSLTTLRQQIKQVEETKQVLEEAWEHVQKQLQLAKEKVTTTEVNVKHARQRLAETKEKYQQAEEQFVLKLTEAKFLSASEYREAKREASVRQQLKAVIERYNEEVTSLTKRVDELKEQLKDKENVPIVKLQEKVKQLKEKYDEAFNQFNETKGYLRDGRRQFELIEETYKNIQEMEGQLSRITDLYDVIRGQNDMKLSFERFLQIEYLEQIIDAANQRLRHLSQGQFMLMRSERQESHGRQSGLALDVYDAYTGQTRDVKTLSGGEKFNASLCLALGMSDVIQSFQGNVSIKTMFIDEGFGSLDEESLHKAIDTLIELQESGRMIGVISHVKELKSIFPAVLEVKKNKEGHSETHFITK